MKNIPGVQAPDLSSVKEKAPAVDPSVVTRKTGDAKDAVGGALGGAAGKVNSDAVKVATDDKAEAAKSAVSSAQSKLPGAPDTSATDDKAEAAKSVISSAQGNLPGAPDTSAVHTPSLPDENLDKNIELGNLGAGSAHVDEHNS